MRQLLSAIVACGALASIGAPARADGDWWEEWEEAMEDARKEAEEDREKAWERSRRGPAYYGPGWGTPGRHGYGWHRGRGWSHGQPGYGHGQHPPYWHEPGPLPLPYVSTEADDGRQVSHRQPYGSRWFEDAGWYEGDAPAPRPLPIVPPRPSGPGARSERPGFVGGRPAFRADSPPELVPHGRLEPIPDERFSHGGRGRELEDVKLEDGSEGH
ncbi:MAG TPA: hypothetical protein VML55_02200 [Planctomycetaceae bacterium]|nr:hypothetical protein [Planctomycetaceae bacterium]